MASPMFKIKKGLDKDLKNVAISEGQILITTDTKKMYVDISSTKRINIATDEADIASLATYADDAGHADTADRATLAVSANDAAVAHYVENVLTSAIKLNPATGGLVFKDMAGAEIEVPVIFGGHNLLSKTYTKADEWVALGLGKVEQPLIDPYTGKFKLSDMGIAADDKVVYSLDLKNEEKTGIFARLKFFAAAADNTAIATADGIVVEYGEIGRSFVVTQVPAKANFVQFLVGNKDANQNAVETIYYKNPQFELGEKPTEWAPNPLDVVPKATADESGNNIKANYGVKLALSNQTLSLKNKNDAILNSVTLPDNNTTYSFSTDDSNKQGANGTFYYTSSTGAKEHIAIKGLKSAAYKDASGTWDINAVTATSATKATSDSNGNTILSTYGSQLKADNTKNSVTLTAKNGNDISTITLPNDILSVGKSYDNELKFVHNDNTGEVINFPRIGGRNLIKNTNENEIVVNHASTTNESCYTIYTATKQQNAQIEVPYGASYRASVDVFVPVEGTFRIDINNGIYKNDTFITSPNDNDNYNKRVMSAVPVKVNTWTRIYWGSTNDAESNTAQASIYPWDHLYFKPKTAADFTWKARRPKIEIGEVATDWTPNPVDAVDKATADADGNIIKSTYGATLSKANNNLGLVLKNKSGGTLSTIDNLAYLPLAGGTVTGVTTFNQPVNIAIDQDVTPAGKNGSLIIGKKDGINIAIDGNEIMARNKAWASTLYINIDGGNISTGAGGITTTGDMTAKKFIGPLQGTADAATKDASGKIITSYLASVTHSNDTGRITPKNGAGSGEALDIQTFAIGNAKIKYNATNKSLDFIFS